MVGIRNLGSTDKPGSRALKVGDIAVGQDKRAENKGKAKRGDQIGGHPSGKQGHAVVPVVPEDIMSHK